MSPPRAVFAGLALMLAVPSVWAQCDVQTPIEPNDSVVGTLANSDCTIQELAGDGDDMSLVDLYRVTLPFRGIFNVLMQSNDVNPFLWLTDENLEIFIAFDDSGEGVNAQIVRVLEAGTYIILVNTNTLEPQTGPYTLRTRFIEVYPAIAPALQLLLDDEGAP